jgi:hypothetical protein
MQFAFRYYYISLTSRKPATRIFPFQKSGGVAQLVRARGSYPRRPGFESLHRHCLNAEVRMQNDDLGKGALFFIRHSLFCIHHSE